MSASVSPREHSPVFSEIKASPAGSVHSEETSRKEEGMSRDQRVRHSLQDDQMQELLRNVVDDAKEMKQAMLELHRECEFLRNTTQKSFPSHRQRVTENSIIS